MMTEVSLAVRFRLKDIDFLNMMWEESFERGWDDGGGVVVVALGLLLTQCSFNCLLLLTLTWQFSVKAPGISNCFAMRHFAIFRCVFLMLKVSFAGNIILYIWQYLRTSDSGGPSYYVSQFTVETYSFADGRCLFKQPQSTIFHWIQYYEESPKKFTSVRPSVHPFVTLIKCLLILYY